MTRQWMFLKVNRGSDNANIFGVFYLIISSDKPEHECSSTLTQTVATDINQVEFGGFIIKCTV